MIRPPLVCTALYEAVTSRAITCQCDSREMWGCGRSNHPYGGMVCCEGSHLDTRPLVVVARDPHLPLHRTTELPASELVALCPGCATRRANAVKKAAADGEEQLALFPED